MSPEQTDKKKVQVKVPAEVAKIMKQWGGREIKLAAARGSLPMSGPHLVTVLFVFCHGKDEELKAEALSTLKDLSSGLLVSALCQDDIIPEVVELVVRVRYRDPEVLLPLMAQRNLSLKTLLFLAERASGRVLERLADNAQAIQKSPALKALLINNSNMGDAVKMKLGWTSAPPCCDPEETVEKNLETSVDEFDDDNDFSSPGSFDDAVADEGISKYQQLLDMPVAEKIKMAITGDKEWRTLLLRESNKLVTSAVLKNPRITENEVVAVAKNRASSDDMIRIILLNKEWLKLYEIKKALAIHPRTPLQKAMRFLDFLTEKDMRDIARSKNVPQAVVNGARRLLMAKGK